jgi:Fur family peroxide stress response transcriptional regulator
MYDSNNSNNYCLERRDIMPMIKNSKQRAAIKTYLMSTKEHPTADMVYFYVRNEFPSISLGTVYRNLNLLAELGEAVKITTEEGGDRFDGNVEPHYHVVCTSCGKVEDIELSTEHVEELYSIIEKTYEGKILSHNLMFRGQCKDCLKDKE